MAGEILHIHGVELTQATQHFNSSQFLSNPADYGPNNSIELVVGKPIVLRVYPTVLSVDSLRDVTISYTLRRRGWPQPWRSVTSALRLLTLEKITVKRGLPSMTYRTSGFSYDLLLPAHDAYGQLRFEATISAPGCDPANIVVDFSVKLKQVFKLDAVLIRYRGPESRDVGATVLDLAAPTFQEFLNTTSWAINCFPVSATADIKLMGEMEYAKPLTLLNNNDFGPWDDLRIAVLQAALASPSSRGAVAHGLLPVSPTTNYSPSVSGFGGFGAGVSFSGNGVDLAHEFGHSANLKHAPCPSTIGDPDLNFPTYMHPFGPGPGAHIGEIGMDCTTGFVRDNFTCSDVMGYCDPRWISPYHYRKLLRNSIFEWRVVDPRPHHILQRLRGIPMKWLPNPPLRLPKGIAVIGLERERGKVELRNVTRTPVGPTWAAGEPSGLKVQLVGARNKVLAEAELLRSHGQAQGGASDRSSSSREAEKGGVLVGVIRSAERGESIRVVKAKRELWVRRAPGSAIRVKDFNAKVADGKLIASWDADPACGDNVHFWLRWRCRGQKTWSAIKTGIQESPTELDLHFLPSGSIEVQVVAHDGFDSVSSTSRAVKIPKRPPVPVIYHPRGDESLVAGRMIRLWGNAVLCNGNYAKAAALTWTIDGQRVGQGDDIWVKAPLAGMHDCVLSAKDGNRKQEHRVRFITVEPQAQA